GMRFTSFYGQASCTAGRAAFITGQLPVRTGLTTVGIPGTDIGLQPEDPTLADVLKTLGYNTGQFGKNHLGDLEKHLPHRHGFDEFRGNLYHLDANEVFADKDRPTDAAFKKKYDPRGVISGTANGPTKDEGMLDPARMPTYDKEILDHTFDYIKRKAKEDKPFFVWYNPSRLHIYQHLLDDQIGTSRADKNGEDNYSDALAQHDIEVGKLLALLDELKLTDNTIVLYTTDNGAYKYMWPQGGTSPFRGDKGTSWEGGVRVPAIIRWPGKVAPGVVNSELVSMEDWFTTFASIAGEPDVKKKLQKGARYNGKKFKVLLEGFDQTDMLLGKAPSKRTTYFYYDEANLTGVRYNQFKLLFSSKRSGKWDDQLAAYGRPILINLLMDPYEEHTDDDYTRKYSEFKNWVYAPLLGVLGNHLKSFQKFPPRQTPLTADFTVDIERIKKALGTHD
ncbi:MAG: sulfatase-like hydrolase/transferase, partial [Pseudomonadales bacterium]|nr:sulfatase-like hydrolase/transferase [Pseudomonadales bacterium]